MPKYKKCIWCRCSSDSQPGVFDDVDSLDSYGIPVCPNCGGSGRVLDSNEFESETRQIAELRFAYCPLNPEKATFLPPTQRLTHLKALEQAVITFYKQRGGVRWCLAQGIARGDLRDHIESEEEQVRDALSVYLSGGYTEEEYFGFAQRLKTAVDEEGHALLHFSDHGALTTEGQEINYMDFADRRILTASESQLWSPEKLYEELSMKTGLVFENPRLCPRPYLAYEARCLIKPDTRPIQLTLICWK